MDLNECKLLIAKRTDALKIKARTYTMTAAFSFHWFMKGQLIKGLRRFQRIYNFFNTFVFYTINLNFKGVL